MAFNDRDRDIAIRTIYGEAGREGHDGWAAVAHVMKNRSSDKRWPNTISGVALQPKQFSAWNSGAGGNSLPYKLTRHDPKYHQIGNVVDKVMSGEIQDQTYGSTHYYSPAGMRDLTNKGHQSNLQPRWLSSEYNKAGKKAYKIGGHIFTGKSSGYAGAITTASITPALTPTSVPTDATPTQTVDGGNGLAAQPASPIAQGSTPPAIPDYSRFSYASSSPQQRFNEAQQHVVDDAQKEMGTNAFSILSDAASLEWGLGSIVRNKDFGFVEMSDDQRTEMIDRFSKDVPTEHIGELSKAQSFAQAKHIRERILEEVELEKRLGEQGVVGTGARVLMAMFDPVAIAASVATDGIAAPVILANKASRLKRMLLTSSSAVSADVITSAVISSENYTFDTKDYLYSALGAGAFGAAFAGLRKNRNVNEELEWGELSKKAKDELDAKLAADAENEFATQQPPQGSAGSAQIGFEEAGINKPSADRFNAAKLMKIPKTAFATVRRVVGDSAGSLKSSEHPLVRHSASQLGEDAVGNADHSVNGFTADLRATQRAHQFEAEFNRVVNHNYKDWAKAEGVNVFQNPMKRTEFGEQVSDAIENPDFDYHPSVSKTARDVSKLYGRHRVLAQNPGYLDGKNIQSIKGFEDVAENSKYLNREYDFVSLGNGISNFGLSRQGDVTMSRGLDSLFAKAMLDANPNLGKKAAVKLARWHVQKLHRVGLEADTEVHRALSGEDLKSLKTLLVEDFNAKGVTDGRAFDSIDEIDGIVAALRKEGDGGTVKHAKKRALFDNSFKAHLIDKNGLSQELSVKEFLVRDIQSLFGVYNSRMSGAQALGYYGIRSKGDIHKSIQDIKETSHMVPNYSKRDLDRDVKNLEYLYTNITKSPIGSYGRKMFEERNSFGGQVSSAIRDSMFIRLMNNMGITQLPEFGNTLGVMGFRSMVTAMPSMKGFLRNARTGKLNDDVLDEIEAIGVGIDPLRHVSHSKFNAEGSFINPQEGELMAKYRNLAELGKRGTNYVSGMLPINSALQRLTGKMVAQKIAHMAHGVSKMDVKRLASLGLGKGELESIMDNIRKHSVVEGGGVRGKKLKALRLKDWDLEARTNFEMALFRTTRKMIQENDAGNMHRWMSNPMAQMLMQFRTFVTVGLFKQTLAGLHLRHDPRTWLAFALTTFTGSLTYSGQTYMNSIGRGDKDEFLAKNLSYKSIGSGAFQRSGWMSILPMAFDTGWMVFNDEGIFNSRASGLSNDILGNPTADFFQKAYRVARGAGRAATSSDYDFSAKNVRDAMSLLWFGNAMGVKQMTNILSQEFPESQTE